MNTGFKPHFFKELEKLESGNFWFCGRNHIILWALHKYLPEFKSFLEIGCGTGFVIAGIAKQFPKASILGSEYFEEGLVFAQQRVPTAEFSRMDARHLPYESEMDAIGAFDVLEHIEDDEVVLQQIFKALKPGGLYSSLFRNIVGYGVWLTNIPAISDDTIPKNCIARFVKLVFKSFEARHL